MPMAEASKSVGADSIRPKKIAILVAGMHRSGTSTTTRILNLLGCDLPRTPLVVPDSYKKFNEKGHWESERVKDLNDEILSSAGSSWDDWRAFDAGWYASPVAEKFREQAQILLKEEYGDSRLFVLKDPRICRLLEFWIKETEEFGAEVRVVSPIRNPLDIASSLETRDGIDSSTGHLLWLRHVLHAEAASRHLRRAYLRYDTLVTEVQAVAERLEQHLEISWPKRSSVNSEMEIDEFLSPKLRHHRADDAGFLRNPRLSRWIQESFDLFDRWGHAEVHATDTETLDRIRTAFDEATPAFSRAIAAGTKATKELIATRKTLADLNGAVTARDQQIHTLNQALTDRNGQIHTLNGVVTDRDHQIRAFNQALADRDKLLNGLYESVSWRITAPLRTVRRVGKGSGRKTRSFAKWVLRIVYRRIPLPLKMKMRFKEKLSDFLPILLGRTHIDEGTSGDGADRSRHSVEKTSDVIDSERLAAKLIAFYLPQFHPIPENDEWWGAGFTEWTNVSKARANYEGHHQPRLPADLGFYDLRVVEVMEQQAELASRHGIHGFCYYYYWFGGRRLLEMPLERMLETGRPDFPFCLCWANENWTRSWDGADHEVLIAQQHSDEDDTAILRDLIRYFEHPNYIRINGRPLFLVYRSSLLPNIRRTIHRWRDLFREESGNEIYLVLAETFELSRANHDPKRYGFNASVEFPPFGLNRSDYVIDPPGTILNPDYSGTGMIFDYRSVVEGELTKKTPPYTRFRCVMPGWDNTARNQNQPSIFHYTTPQVYQKWLRGAIAETRQRGCSEDERLIFINAWNEWGEGAYLEPDQRDGPAYLQATRAALEQTGLQSGKGFSQPPMVGRGRPQRNVTISRPSTRNRIEEINSRFEKRNTVGIVFHIYYEDVVEQILSEYLDPIREKTDVLVTTPESVSLETIERLEDHLPNLHISTSENRGRDIRPFLQIYPFIFEKHYEMCCKIHTKKSIHRVDGESLRRHALDSLLKCNVDEIVQQFSQDEELGMIVPPDAFLYLSENSDWYDNNRPWLDELLTRMGESDQIGKYQFDFPAGSMYWFRVASLTKLLDRQFIDLEEFEPEAGQLDGALQHSVERIISLLVRKAGYKVQIASRIS